ncbi:unnamed protein product [Sphagnum compactum]
MLSDELNFLRGAGCIGHLLPFGSPLLPMTKRKQRKISWDLPEYGDIWYNIKHYHRLCLIIKQQLIESRQSLNYFHQQQNDVYMKKLREVLVALQKISTVKHTETINNLSPELSFLWDKLPDKSKRAELNDTIKVINEAMTFYVDAVNLPKLPSTLGKFSLMIASANMVKKSPHLNCVPTTAYQLSQSKAPKQTGTVVNAESGITIDGVLWQEVMVVITTGESAPLQCTFMHMNSWCFSGSVVRFAQSAAGVLDTCVEIRPFRVSFTYFLYHRLLGRKISRWDDGIVLCVDDHILAQTLIDLLSGCFTTYSNKNEQLQDAAEVEDVVGADEDVEEDVLTTVLDQINAQHKSVGRARKPTIYNADETSVGGSNLTGRSASSSSLSPKSQQLVHTLSMDQASIGTGAASGPAVSIGSVFESEISKELTKQSRAISNSLEGGNDLSSQRQKLVAIAKTASTDMTRDRSSSRDINSMKLDFEAALARKRAESVRLDASEVPTLTDNGVQRLTRPGWLSNIKRSKRPDYDDSTELDVFPAKFSMRKDMEKQVIDSLNVRDYSKDRTTSPINILGSNRTSVDSAKAPRTESGQYTAQQKEEAVKRAESTRIRVKR